MSPEAGDTYSGTEGRMLYGSVTVEEPGRVVIPAQAKRDHDITPRHKLTVFGGPGGLALIGVERLLDLLGDTNVLAEHVRKAGGA